MTRKFNRTPNPMIVVDGKEIYLSRSAAVATIILLKNTNDKKTYVLLGRRGIGCPDFVGYWNAPCGYLDYDETLPEAVVREIYEETGFEADTYTEQLGCRVLRSDMDQPWYTHGTPHGTKQNVTARFGMLIELDHLPELTNEHSEKDEVSDLRWVCVDDLYDYEFAFNHHKIIREYITRSSIRLVVKRATVLLSTGTDLITIYPDMISPFPTMGYDASFKMDVQKGYGVEYCKTVLGVHPEVIDAR